jgi:hypothetical protein
MREFVRGLAPCRAGVFAMPTNVGPFDRIVRVVVGLALLSLIFAAEGVARWFGLIGLMPLVTAAVGWCPVYTPLRVNTCARHGGKAKA